jgi:FMN phosphatase YigB (HAD superfamily)
MKIIFDYNRTIFNPDTSALYSGAFELLSLLSKNHELFLISKNEPGRKDNLKELGIEDFFKETIFVKEKSVEIFKEIVGQEEKALVIGDRIKGEISVGNKLNFTTVWIRQGKFANEGPESKGEEPNHTINDIRELMEILKKYEN